MTNQYKQPSRAEWYFLAALKQAFLDCGVLTHRVDDLQQLECDRFELAPDGFLRLKEHPDMTVRAYILDVVKKRRPEYFRGLKR